MANPLDGLSKQEDTLDRYARIGREHEQAMVNDAMDKIKLGLPQRMLNEEVVAGRPGVFNNDNKNMKMESASAPPLEKLADNMSKSMSKSGGKDMEM